MEDERHRKRSRWEPHPSSHLPWALETRTHPTSPESPQCWDPWSWLQRTGQGDQVQRVAACSGHDLGFQEEPLSVLTQTGGEQRPCVCVGGGTQAGAAASVGTSLCRVAQGQSRSWQHTS